MTDPRNVIGSGAESASQGSLSPSLLEGVKARDPAAWRRLARLYGPLVFAWCRSRGLQPADAEDVLQEVFVTVDARISEFRHDREGGTFRGWLSVITRNKIGDWMRRTQAGQAVGGSDALARLADIPVADGTSWPQPGEPGDLFFAHAAELFV